MYIHPHIHTNIHTQPHHISLQKVQT
uniref:Uncharacterized protein n=1 Tax=Arundo donax TaxID=35708 RepID=A0A0A9AB36_ARUDO